MIKSILQSKLTKLFIRIGCPGIYGTNGLKEENPLAIGEKREKGIYGKVLDLRSSSDNDFSSASSSDARRRRLESREALYEIYRKSICLKLFRRGA